MVKMSVYAAGLFLAELLMVMCVVELMAILLMSDGTNGMEQFGTEINGGYLHKGRLPAGGMC